MDQLEPESDGADLEIPDRPTADAATWLRERIPATAFDTATFWHVASLLASYRSEPSPSILCAEQLAHFETIRERYRMAAIYDASPLQALADVGWLICFADRVIARAALNSQPQPNEALRSAAEAFIKKIDEIESNESYGGIWGIAYVHGCKYTGPNYRDEYAALKDALASRSQPHPVAGREFQMLNALKSVKELFSQQFLVQKVGGAMTNGDQSRIDEMFIAVGRAIESGESATGLEDKEKA